MAIDANNFLHSLAKWAAARAGLSYPGQVRCYRNEGRNNPSSVILPYPGPGVVADPTPAMAVQVATVGMDADAAMSQLQKLFEAFSNDGIGLRMQTIDGFTAAGAADGTWRLIAIVFSQRPGLIGLVADRHKAVFNMTVHYTRLTEPE